MKLERCNRPLQVAIEMNNRHGAVGFVDTPQQGQRDSVVTTESDNTRKSLASPRKTKLVRIGEGLAHQNAVVSFFDLLDRPSVVETGSLWQQSALNVNWKNSLNLKG